MAILNGLIRKMSGSAGDLTFKQLNGQTVVSEKVSKMFNPRSPKQMAVRTRWTNVQAMYSVLRPLLRNAFENKPVGLSDYNMFMKLGARAANPVYLTKQMVAGGACVAAPYQISQGSLPAIVISGSGNAASTDIFLGSMTIGASTTVAEFSKAVVENNPDYRYGDQISYFMVKQMVNEATKIPYCQTSSSKVVLDAANDTKLWSMVHKNGFFAQDGCVGKYGNDGNCVYCWVHSRKSYDGKVLVSTQSFIDANSMLADYTSALALNLAASSYGTSRDVYLAPDGAGNVNGNDNGNVNGNGGTTPTPGGGDSL